MGKATLNIWDTAGQASHRSQAVLYARRADVCVIVYDITDAATLETARELLADVLRTGTKSHCAICLAGNKSDRESQRQVSMVDGLRLAQEFGVSLFFETSAAHDSNLSILLCNAILAYVNTTATSLRSDGSNVPILTTSPCLCCCDPVHRAATLQTREIASC
jgi:GTPase SAR1 family protein